jgi:hypothetical protein
MASAVLASACGDDGAAAGPTDRRIAQLQVDAAEFSTSYHGAWPDIQPALDRMVADVVFYDPADGDFIIEGKAKVVPAILGFARFYSETEWSGEETFLSADGAAYRVAVAEGLWPPWLTEPASHPPVVELDVFRFEDDGIASFDIWFEDDSLEMLEFGCFAIDSCPGLRTVVDRYLDAWSSGADDAIAALYADDAVFTDSLFDIDAAGPAEIGALAEARFGPGAWSHEVVELYAQTRGPEPATEEQPDSGPVIAVGIHYRVSSADGATAREGLTTFELGTRQPNGFDLHPQGLITREEVFHDPNTLIAAGDDAAARE